MPLRPRLRKALPERVVEDAQLHFDHLVPAPLQRLYLGDSVLSQMSEQRHIVHADVVRAVAVVAECELGASFDAVLCMRFSTSV